MPSPGAQDGGNTGPKKSYDSQSQSVRRLTVKQLSDGIKSSGAEGIMVDGKEISNVREKNYNPYTCIHIVISL